MPGELAQQVQKRAGCSQPDRIHNLKVVLTYRAYF